MCKLSCESIAREADSPTEPELSTVVNDHELLVKQEN